MLYELSDKKRVQVDLDAVIPNPDTHRYAGFFSSDQSPEVLEKFQFSPRPLEEARSNSSMIFEGYETYDFLCIHIPDHKTLSDFHKVLIYISKDVILFLCKDGPLLKKIQDLLMAEETHIPAFDRFLCIFFEKITLFEVDYFDRLEQSMYKLEQVLMETQTRNLVPDIVSLRKKLMLLKRHYEQLLDVVDELQENENELLSSAELRYFKIFSNRAERHYQNISNLRDYVTQIREAYQAQMDIDLNNTMKIFTIISTIFLPLSLIVGWYGMNLHMPEYQWPYTYPAVIAASVIIVLVCIAFFRKKKWF